MGWMVNATPLPLYPRVRPGTNCIGGLVGPRAGLEGYVKSRATWFRSPDRTARSESLYQLNYPVHQRDYYVSKITREVWGGRIFMYGSILGP
jgi:hypothetical protein